MEKRRVKNKAFFQFEEIFPAASNMEVNGRNEPTYRYFSSLYGALINLTFKK